MAERTEAQRDAIRARQLAAECTFCGAEPGKPCRQTARIVDGATEYYGKGEEPVRADPHRSRGL